MATVTAPTPQVVPYPRLDLVPPCPADQTVGVRPRAVLVKTIRAVGRTRLVQVAVATPLAPAIEAALPPAVLGTPVAIPRQAATVDATGPEKETADEAARRVVEEVGLAPRPEVLVPAVGAT